MEKIAGNLIWKSGTSDLRQPFFAFIADIVTEKESPIFIPRRRALGILTLGGMGVFFGNALHAAGIVESRWSSNVRIQQRARLLRIPVEWVDTLGPRVLDYATFLSRLRLRTITPAQIIAPHLNKRGKIQNTLPPTNMWPSIRNTLVVVDRAALMLRDPLREVTSAYRSPAYNAACRGAARDSWHMRNNALDMKFTASSPGRVAEALTALRNRGMFKGGVGRYGGFTHIDTRGENVSW